MKGFLSLILLFLSGCGYHFEGNSDERVSISIPYIKGDPEGRLNEELARAITTSGVFEYRQKGAELLLEAEIIADGDDRIGYRYDRNPTTGKLRDNIVGTENRHFLSIQIKLTDTYTNEIVFGPQVVQGSADYDYVDSNSIRDLVFLTPQGPQKVLDFSLGQLDSVDGAHDDTRTLVYRILAQKVVDGLIAEYSIPTSSSQSMK